MPKTVDEIYLFYVQVLFFFTKFVHIYLPISFSIFISLAILLQQWIDLARFSGLQPRKSNESSNMVSESTDAPLLECSSTNAKPVDENSNQSGDSSTS